MKNPYVLVGIGILLLLIGIFSGKAMANAEWYKKLWTPKSNGTTPNGNGAGNGNGNGDLPIDPNSIERTANGSIMLERNSGANGNTNQFLEKLSGQYLTLPCRGNEKKYTYANPFHYGGCSYVFLQQIQSQGVTQCQFKKISCP